MCCSCIRLSHRESPFHRIERWNGGYSQSADLWEVGTYLLFRHHSDEVLCETLKKWCTQIESDEVLKDNVEQDHLRQTQLMLTPSPVRVPEDYFEDTYINGEEPYIEEESDREEELEDADLYASKAGSASAGAGPAYLSNSSANFIRVVHSNGLHHISMVSCECHGSDVLPLDLFAAHLLPTSFKRTKTLFTSQVLDMFCLCNLKLKASAYQFYQLLHQMTCPMAPAEVINLYREFRRMTRLWRWMKKLKWAGYPNNTKKVNGVQAGELAMYCPACPQSGINIPGDWKDDTARYV